MEENATLSQKLEELDRLRQASGLILQSLARDGVPGIDLGGARLELFIEFLMPYESGTNERRLDFELIWETKANEALQNVVKEVARQKLTQGINLVAPSGPNGHGPGLRGV